MNFSGRVTIIVKTNAAKTEINGFDESRNAWKVNIAAPPENNKANIEIIKFFTKRSKKKVRIVSGLTNREKILELS